MQALTQKYCRYCSYEVWIYFML